MAVEIKEVVIRLVINQDNECPDKKKQEIDPRMDRDAVIQACVQEVLRVLKHNKDH